MTSEIENINKRIKELNNRLEELEEIHIKMMNEGREEDFDYKYGIEYENISDEMYRQRLKLEELEKHNNK